MGEYVLGVTAIIALLLLCLSPVACTIYEEKLIADAIKNGIDPIDARCAIDSLRYTACQLRAAKGR